MDTTLTKVLMFVPLYPPPIVGGLERQAHELAKRLVSQGIEVSVLSGRHTKYQESYEIIEGVKVHRFPWYRNKLMRILFTPFTIFILLVKNAKFFNVVHSHQFSMIGLYIIIIAKLLGKPVITKLPGVDEYGIPGLKNSFMGTIKIWILKLSDGLIAMAPKNFEEIRSIGFPQERILMLPNGIDNIDRNKLSTAAADKSSGKCRVVYVGRLSEEKNVDFLLNAWVSVSKRFPVHCTLEICGSGPLEQSLKNIASDLGILDTVFFHGHITGVKDFILGCDIFVLPSRTEGNSNAILEAMDCALPIISTRVGGTPLLVGAAGASYLYEPNDSVALKELLVQLIGSVDMRNSLGNEMRARVENFFSINIIVAHAINAYSMLVQRKCNELHRCGSFPL